MRKIPEKLTEIQEQRRKATSEKVTNAILELQAQGYGVKIKDLIFVTGLSRSVFAKPHIRRILIEYSVVEPRKFMPDETPDKIVGTKQYKALLVEKNGYIDRLLLENERLKQECELLRGKIHLLMHKISNINNSDF